MPLFFTFFLAFLISLFSIFETLVFNDEVFLALCFITFLFFVYNFLNGLFFNIFQDRSKKFQADLFLSSKSAFSLLFRDAQQTIFEKHSWKVANTLFTLYRTYSFTFFSRGFHKNSVLFGWKTSSFLSEIFFCELSTKSVVEQSCTSLWLAFFLCLPHVSLSARPFLSDATKS
jgi:hypothetical protein